jgi:toxin HigB-1
VQHRCLLFPRDMHRIALRKLIIISRAKDLNDLNIPPGNRLERLSGKRHGQYSIRINDQFRVCFWWEKGTASCVEITDYH